MVLLILRFLGWPSTATNVQLLSHLILQLLNVGLPIELALLNLLLSLFLENLLATTHQLLLFWLVLWFDLLARRITHTSGILIIHGVGWWQLFLIDYLRWIRRVLLLVGSRLIAHFI